MGIELPGGFKDRQQSGDAEFPCDQVQLRAAKYLSVALHHHPALHVRVEVPHISAEALVLATVHGPAHQLPTLAPGSPIVRSPLAGPPSGDLPPEGEGVQGEGVSQEEITLENHLFDSRRILQPCTRFHGPSEGFRIPGRQRNAEADQNQLDRIETATPHVDPPSPGSRKKFAEISPTTSPRLFPRGVRRHFCRVSSFSGPRIPRRSNTRTVAASPALMAPR